MKTSARKSVWAMVALSLAVVLTMAVSVRTAAAQAGGQKMEDVYKNIKAMKGQPADMLIPTMVFFEAALGVGCGYCHDADGTKRDADTKDEKKTARKMMEMVNAINKNTFEDKGEVNCMTCHQGRAKPISVPVVAGTQLPAAFSDDFERARPKPAPIPSITVDQIFDKYLAAVGGTAALEKVPSLTARGSIIQRRPGRNFTPVPLQIDSRASGMHLATTGGGQNQNLTSYSSAGGWARGGAANPRDLRAQEIEVAKLEDAFNLPAQLKGLLLEAKVANPESFGGRELYVITGKTRNLPMLKLWFEKDSGMLARLDYHTSSVFGSYPTRIEHSDYRDLNGRKVPYSWRIAQTRNREYTYVMDNIAAAPVEDGKFTKPPATAAPAAR